MAGDIMAQRKRVLVAPLSVAMTSDQQRTIRHAAFLTDETVSSFIRAAAMKAAERTINKAQRKAA